MLGFYDKYTALVNRHREACKQREYGKAAQIDAGIRDLFNRTPSVPGMVVVGEWKTSHRIVTDNGKLYALVDKTPYPVKKEGEVYVLDTRN